MRTAASQHGSRSKFEKEKVIVSPNVILFFEVRMMKQIGG